MRDKEKVERRRERGRKKERKRERRENVGGEKRKK